MPGGIFLEKPCRLGEDWADREKKSNLLRSRFLKISYICRVPFVRRSIEKKGIMTDKELPQIDVPEDWIAGTDISKELLRMYTNFPCRLKAEIVVLCMGGEVEATLNLTHFKVKANQMVILMPGSIFQIDRVEGDLKIYVLGFSSEYSERKHLSVSAFDAIYFTLERPLIDLKPEAAKLMEGYFQLLIGLFEKLNEATRREIADNVYTDAHKGMSMFYRRIENQENSTSSRNERVCRDFANLVIQHYREKRSVEWYAQKIGITHAHLSIIIKQVTNKTCTDIIATMVIMDAKSQLKLTSQSVQEISDSLHFANVSFFGKYFKRHVGMSPQAYRSDG